MCFISEVSLCPVVEGGEFCSSYMHLQSSFLSNYAQSLKGLNFMVFLFLIIENFESAVSEKMNNICLRAEVGCLLQTWQSEMAARRPMLSVLSG